MPRKKTRYFMITVSDDIGASPVSWEQLPEELLERCPSTLIHDIKCYSREEEKFKKDSVLYIAEIDKKQAELTPENWIEDKRNKIIYVL